jgi:hypothetical protein
MSHRQSDLLLPAIGERRHSIGLKPHGVLLTCSDLDDFRPANDAALPEVIPST